MAREDALWIDKYPNSAAIVMADEDGNKFRFVAENGELIVSKNGTTVNVVSSTGVEFADDQLLTLGNDNDQAMVNRSTSLSAATALTGVLIGTPVSAATPANSLLISNVTADGDIAFFGVNTADSTEYLRFDASADLVVFNEASGDVDFRVESNGNANAIAVDGGNDSVGILAAAPASGIALGGAVAATSSIKSTDATAGVGYGTGAGGAVTQMTNKSTGVTLNKVTGQITMSNAALNMSTSVGFTLTNSAIAATDVVVVNVASGATADSYLVGVDAVASGSCRIHVRNVSGSNLSEAIVLNFAVIKGVAA